MARPSKAAEWLTVEALAIIEGWRRSGLTDKDIAHNIGISEKTLYTWKIKYTQFADAMRQGKEIADTIVENALYKRAIGHVVKTVTIDEILDEDGKPTGNKQRRTTLKEVSPDTTACIWWLKNRKADQWSDKPLEVIEEYEDDGLIAALKEGSERLLKDDSWMLPVEDMLSVNKQDEMEN